MDTSGLQFLREFLVLSQLLGVEFAHLQASRIYKEGNNDYIFDKYSCMQSIVKPDAVGAFLFHELFDISNILLVICQMNFTQTDWQQQ